MRNVTKGSLDAKNNIISPKESSIYIGRNITLKDTNNFVAQYKDIKLSAYREKLS